MDHRLARVEVMCIGSLSFTLCFFTPLWNPHCIVAKYIAKYTDMVKSGKEREEGMENVSGTEKGEKGPSGGG